MLSIYALQEFTLKVTIKSKILQTQNLLLKSDFMNLEPHRVIEIFVMIKMELASISAAVSAMWVFRT